MEDSCERLWSEFLSSGSGVAETARYASHTSWQFGVGTEQGDALLACVLSGHKLATSAVLWAYEHEGEALPRIGDFSVVTDGLGRARLVIKTTSVSIVAFDSVDEAHAYAEGEGDRSLEYWRKVHWDCFTQDLSEIGIAAVSDMPVVCERFEVVFPLSLAPEG